jgi:hypothetical protein
VSNFGQKNDETGDMGPNHVTVSPVNYVGHLSITPATYSHRDEKKNFFFLKVKLPFFSLLRLVGFFFFCRPCRSFSHVPINGRRHRSIWAVTRSANVPWPGQPTNFF